MVVFERCSDLSLVPALSESDKAISHRAPLCWKKKNNNNNNNGVL
jgi:hypothetical protein